MTNKDLIAKLQAEYLLTNEVTVIDSTIAKPCKYLGKLEPINTLTVVGVRTKGVLSNDIGTKDYA